jgi:hypothetical protein
MSDVNPTALALFVRFVRQNPDIEDVEVLMRAFEAYRNADYTGALCSPTYDRQPFD